MVEDGLNEELGRQGKGGQERVLCGDECESVCHGNVQHIVLQV